MCLETRYALMKYTDQAPATHAQSKPYIPPIVIPITHNIMVRDLFIIVQKKNTLLLPMAAMALFAEPCKHTARPAVHKI